MKAIELADLLAGAILDRVVAASPRAVRVGLDCADPEAAARLADVVGGGLSRQGQAVAVVSTQDYLQRRSVRLEYGGTDVEAAYSRWVDHAALSREVLDPVVDPVSPRWLPRLWDAEADRPARTPTTAAAPGQVIIVAGPYLLRWELAGGFDLTAHLVVSAAGLRRRFADDGDPRPGAWQLYLASCDPAARADLVVRYDHPDRPAVLIDRLGDDSDESESDRVRT